MVLFVACTKERSAQQPTDDKLEAVFTEAKSNSNLRCLIVCKDGNIVKEAYFISGAANTPHDVRSVTKSVMSTLIGIAIDKGLIASESETIDKYLSPYVGTLDPIHAKMSIQQVLSMSCGIISDELTDPTLYLNWLNAPDQIAYTLKLPLSNNSPPPFSYDSGIAHFSSVILTQASGQPTAQFAQQHLFTLLGIAQPTWATDKRGIANGGAGLKLTPYDMLAFGKLYLAKGRYNGVQVVSEAWISKATTAKISTNNAQPFGPSYGYYWWIGEVNGHSYFFANGYGGQFIVVVPDLQLIVIATNNWENVPSATLSKQWYSTISLIINKIIPLFEVEKPS